MSLDICLYLEPVFGEGCHLPPSVHPSPKTGSKYIHESLYLLNIRGMFLKNIIVKISPFFYPGCLQSVYDALRKIAHNIKKRAQYCINADGGHFEHLL